MPFLPCGSSRVSAIFPIMAGFAIPNKVPIIAINNKAIRIFWFLPIYFTKRQKVFLAFAGSSFSVTVCQGPRWGRIFAKLSLDTFWLIATHPPYKFVNHKCFCIYRYL